MTSKHLYDSQCFDLAEAFLRDEPDLYNERVLEELSWEIQQTIESFIEDARHQLEKRDRS